MSNFQIIVLGIFGALAVMSVGVFSLFGGMGGSASVGSVTIWGTVDAQVVSDLLQKSSRDNSALKEVKYVYKNPETYNEALLDAMASGASPDLFIVSLSDLNAFSDKIIPIPYRSVSQSTFLSSFVDGAQSFLTPQGILALPFTVDPLVMYWNRDMFASAGIATPPVYWNDFLDLAPKITSLDGRSSVIRGTVGLGEWSNVDHAKEILLTLFMQAGDMVMTRASNGSPTVVFGRSPSVSAAAPAESVLRFYTEFANPSKTSYSWNRSLPRSRDAFASGDLAVYFGFVSEARSFASRNPNLRYSIAPVPQIEGNATRYTYGAMKGFAISRTSRNPNGALAVAQALTSKSVMTTMLSTSLLPSVRRDVSVDTSANASATVAAQAALISRGFLDPSPADTNLIFKSMIESIGSGQSTPSEALKDGVRELKNLLSQTI